MDYKKFQQMGGVYKYGYGDSGWSKAKEELEQKKRVILYQKIGIGFAILSFIATVIVIRLSIDGVSREYQYSINQHVASQ